MPHFVYYILERPSCQDSKVNQSSEEVHRSGGIVWGEDNGLNYYFVEQTSADSTEDSEMAIQLLTVAMVIHSTHFPQHKEFHLNTDGAGCYSSANFLAHLPFISYAPGCSVRCSSHSTGE